MPEGTPMARARVLTGYSQDDVAAAVGVTRAMVSYWESGKRQPNDRQIAALARLYRVSPAQLHGLEELDAGGEIARMLFRGADAELPEGTLPGLRAFESFLDQYAALAKAAGFQIRGMTQSPFVTAAGYDTVDDARRKAEEVRAYLRLGVGPVGDVDAVCELLGVTVYRAALGVDLSRTLSGAFFAHPTVGFSLLVNLEMTPGRRRFTLAHELAHALFHGTQKYVLSLPRKTPQERFADAFAGEFLMPTGGMRRVMEEQGIGPRIDDPADVIHLQRYFKVSYGTALVRLRQARLLTALHYEEFKHVRPVLYARGLGYAIDEEERIQDPDTWRIRHYPQRFLRLLRGAIRAGQISVPTAAKLADLSSDEIEDLISEKLGDEPADVLEIDEFEVTGVAGAH